MRKLIGTWNPTRGLWETGMLDLLSEHSEPFSETWPTWGMTRSGVAFELPTRVPLMGGSGSLSLPTPRASRGASGTETMYLLGGERDDSERSQGQVLLKTPTSQLAINGGSQHPDKRKAGGHGPTLADEVEHLLPTPVVTDAAGTRNETANRSDPNSRHHTGRTLTDALLPTPAAGDVMPKRTTYGRGNLTLFGAVNGVDPKDLARLERQGMKVDTHKAIPKPSGAITDPQSEGGSQ